MGTRSLQSLKLDLKVSMTLKNILAVTSRSATSGITHNWNPTLSNGVQLNQANRGWSYEGTISSAGTEVIDLFDAGTIDVGAGAGLDAVGQQVDHEEIVAIIVQNINADGVAGILEVEPDSTNGWAPIGTHDVSNGGGLDAQGLLMKVNPSLAGFDVVDASSHRLLLTANGGDVDFKITVIARNDDDESSSSSSSSSQSSSSSSNSSSQSGSSSPSSSSSNSSSSSP